ncbi:HPr kinase/phosphatase C-terminal domain-containing protein [Croceibacterium sp. LX-88]|uniref:HPr kinase/phosphatase C-terminal domain-containing protein n=1 Tax=Croceibacterium selenioxidans TaxID=2838833 RepID=A0ABS5W479_9SPHN|nr:HPr kinase/phosphatase C-terminal domain-containing protein [Croceibacterium selenioxidans]MBT2134296.1 HPr kinase/phosphatase C-terminal domain-containing protein [Croceibacterium selenioxidans]
MIPVPHQATSVAIKSRGLLIEGPPGSGKSTLALSLIDRGATLVGDDGVMLEVRQGRLWALPPPLITGLLEIRNVGLLNLPAEAAPIALIVQLDSSAPRLPDTVESITLHGVRIPFVRLYPANPALALRAEWALTLHGTP